MERNSGRRSSTGRGPRKSRKGEKSTTRNNDDRRYRDGKPVRKERYRDKPKRYGSDSSNSYQKSPAHRVKNPSFDSIQPSGPHDSVPGERGNQNRDDLIFGRHTVIAAIEHERPLNKVWVASQLKRNPKILDLLNQAKASGAVVEEASQLRLDQLTQYATHQGIVAQVGACEYVELDELITQAKGITSSPVLVAVDGITDPHNLGAIIRSAEAMGAQGLVLPQRRTASVGATVAKVAAGALETLSIARVINLNQALESLKQENFWVYGLTLEAQADISSVDLSGAVVLLIGSEGKGLSAVTQKHCDQTVKIPLAGETQSLNASVAAGIGVYEIFRQRQRK